MDAPAAPLWPEGLSEISVFTVVPSPPRPDAGREDRLQPDRPKVAARRRSGRRRPGEARADSA